MHADLPSSSPPPSYPSSGPWYRELNSYHWYVLIVAAMGWLFDTMDQQLFVLARGPALRSLLGPEATASDIAAYGGYATAIFIVGWATGGLIFGLFGDRFGRATTMMLTILIYSAFTGLSALSVGWVDFAVYRFITGMGVGGEFAAGVSLVAEVMPTRARPYALALLQALSAVGNMTAALISFLIPPQAELTFVEEASRAVGMNLQGVEGWRMMFLIGILPAFLVVVIRRSLKEPETWVQAKKASKDDFHRQMGDLSELFGDPRWRYHTIIGILMAAAGVMGLWGVGFWTPELLRNNVLRQESPAIQDYYASMSSLLMNFGAFFGIWGFGVIAGRFGRRTGFTVAYFLALAATVMVFGFMTEKNQIWWMIPVLGFCSLMLFGGYAVYFPELFPTRLRSTGTGFCYNVARYLAALAPLLLGQLANLFRAPEGTARAADNLSYLTFLSEMGSVDNPFRYATVFVALVVYILGILLVPFAPETKDKPLPE